MEGLIAYAVLAGITGLIVWGILFPRRYDSSKITYRKLPLVYARFLSEEDREWVKQHYKAAGRVWK